MTRFFWAFALLAGLAAPAHAGWYEASSDRFVIYADDSEKDIRRFAENLERYHAALEFITKRKVEKPSPSNRVTIFVVGNQRDIRRLAGTRSRRIAGFYVPRAGASRAFVQDIRLQNGYPSISTVILLHEYAHHFQAVASRFAAPRWASEGSAEFFAATTFNSDGSVLIGRPARHRAGELAFAADVSVAELLDPELYERQKGKRYDAFYGQSWLLYHYLIFSQERQGQLADYLLRVAKGEPSPAAAQAAFGDIDQLQKDLDGYLRQRRMMTFSLKPEFLSGGEVTIRKLSRGEAEMMEVRIRSQRGVTREQAIELLPDARAIAAKYPDDPAVLTALAEAEFDAGNDAEAIAAADKAIAIDPGRKNAYVQKGYALFRRAEDADDHDAAYSEAMRPFAALNALENDHPLPLIYYYRSYIERGERPSDNARHALERALELAPFDRSLAFNVAVMQAGEGKVALATANLQPLAADPHGRGLTQAARRLIEALGNAEEGVPFRQVSRNDEPDDEAEDPDAPEDPDEPAGDPPSESGFWM